MNEPGYMPPPDVDRLLLANLRRSRLEMEESGCKIVGTRHCLGLISFSSSSKLSSTK
jgi:hypothetical protein